MIEAKVRDSKTRLFTFLVAVTGQRHLHPGHAREPGHDEGHQRVQSVVISTLSVQDMKTFPVDGHF